MRQSLSCLGVLALLAASLPCWAQERLPNPVPYSADEPMAEAFTVAKSANYLDTVARFWMKDSCGGCHANYAYLMARPLLAEPGSAETEARRFLEKRLAGLLNYRRVPYRQGEPRIQFESEIVGVAAGLAFDDARTGKLQATTRQALDRMWELQIKAGRRLDGTWSCGCGEFPTVELDPYYCGTLAALAAGVAPERYAQSPQAKDGLTRLRRFFMTQKAPHLHHQAMLLWASLHVDGLMTQTEQRDTVQALLAKQRTDGGWSIKDLENSQSYATGSDGYGTAFALFMLRQAGVSANRPEIVRGVRWLHSHQRASGGWFTATHHAGQRPEGGHGTRELSLLNATAAFAVMALRACEDVDLLPPPRSWEHRPRGLAFRQTTMLE